jgi:hypothetical protein
MHHGKLIAGAAQVSIYLVGWIAGRWKDSRTWLLPLSCIPVIVGAIIIWTASWHHRGVPLFGMSFGHSMC